MAKKKNKKITDAEVTLVKDNSEESAIEPTAESAEQAEPKKELETTYCFICKKPILKKKSIRVNDAYFCSEKCMKRFAVARPRF